MCNTPKHTTHVLHVCQMAHLVVYKRGPNIVSLLQFAQAPPMIIVELFDIIINDTYLFFL